MASTIELLYGASGQVITCTQASLANNAARASTAIDNSSNLFEDILVQETMETGSSGVSATGIVNVFATGTTDGGTTYGEGATGTDAAITLTNPPNVQLIGTINTPSTASKQYKSTPMSVAKIFGGVIPQKVVIIIQNLTGAAFNGTAGNFLLQYQGVQHQAT